jgi:hypothetical protein
MTWSKPNAISEAHPAYEYHCRVGRLSSAARAELGHVVVVVSTEWARTGGHLFWRRWEPTVTADLQLFPAGTAHAEVMEDDSLDLGLEGNELDLALDCWAKGVLRFEEATYAVDWLTQQVGDKVAMDMWGWDLPSQRKNR